MSAEALQSTSTQNRTAAQKRALARIRTARRTLVLDHPFFGALALRLTLTEAPPHITKTMATDGRSLFYGTEFVESLSDEHLVGFFAHEVMHPAMNHHTRRSGRDPSRWNEAADYAVNPILVEAGLKLPDGVLNDPAFEGMSAEQIYDRLPQPEDKSNDPNSNGASSQGGSQSERPGAVLDSPDPIADAGDWMLAVKTAAMSARAMGRMPESFARAVSEILRPRLDWRALLRRFVQQCSSIDYSWRSPNRRYFAGGLYLPALRSDSMPPLVVVVDTSGSIDDVTLAAFRAEIGSIAEECLPEAIYVIYADAQVQRVTRFERGEPIVMEPVGGGGTDFCPAFAYVDHEGLDPACLVYLTDGYGTYPAAPSSYPTLWAMTTHKVAPWGETVRIDA